MPKGHNLINQRFGRLIVIQLTHSNRSGKYWKCICDCGKERTVRGSSLISGKTQSCGCYASHRRMEYHKTDKAKLHIIKVSRSNIGKYRTSPEHAAQVRRYHTFISKANSRNIVVSIDKEDFLRISQLPCFYCGVEYSNESRGKNNRGIFLCNGLDRLDNTRGYDLDNVVPCCKDCNAIKSGVTPSMIYILYHVMQKKGLFNEQQNANGSIEGIRSISIVGIRPNGISLFSDRFNRLEPNRC